MLKSGKIQTDALKVITLSKIKYSTGKKIISFQEKKNSFSKNPKTCFYSIRNSTFAIFTARAIITLILMKQKRIYLERDKRLSSHMHCKSGSH